MIFQPIGLSLSAHLLFRRVFAVVHYDFKPCALKLRWNRQLQILGKSNFLLEDWYYWCEIVPKIVPIFLWLSVILNDTWWHHGRKGKWRKSVLFYHFISSFITYNNWKSLQLLGFDSRRPSGLSIFTMIIWKYAIDMRLCGQSGAETRLML